jgi:aryl-alcohol dehydrogenase-like predicted oxidoreductase
MAAALGLAVVTWGILGAGVLTGKPQDEQRWPDDPVSPRTATVVEALRDVAAEIGCEPAQVAIAWLRSRPVIPIVGARTVEQLQANLDALAISLDDEQRARLDAAGAPELGFPRSFLESEHVRRLINGETIFA